METTICVNYTTLLLVAADLRGATNQSWSPLRMFPQSKGGLQGICALGTVAKLPSSPASKIAVENDSYQILRGGSLVTRSGVGGLDPLGLTIRQSDLFQPFPALNFS